MTARELIAQLKAEISRNENVTLDTEVRIWIDDDCRYKEIDGVDTFDGKLDLNTD